MTESWIRFWVSFHYSQFWAGFLKFFLFLWSLLLNFWMLLSTRFESKEERWNQDLKKIGLFVVDIKNINFLWELMFHLSEYYLECFFLSAAIFWFSYKIIFHHTFQVSIKNFFWIKGKCAKGRKVEAGCGVYSFLATRLYQLKTSFRARDIVPIVSSQHKLKQIHKWGNQQMNDSLPLFNK